jgi:periplasmic divalent cation tolerance protein
MANEIVVLVTTGSEEEAREIANQLVGDKLIACANIVSAVNSVFHWQGKLCNEGEALIIMKSVQENVDQIIERVQELHSYSVPEIIALPVLAGSKDYLKWLHDETAAK